MKWFISAIVVAYGIYFFLGWTDVKKEWQNLSLHLQLNEKIENRIERKGIAKHFFYTDDNKRANFNIQARKSELIVHDFQLQEEIEGVVGSYWDQEKNKAYTLYMPIAFFDYSKKQFTGLDGQLEGFDTKESKLVGKGTFGEAECEWNGYPLIELKKVHGEVPPLASGTADHAELDLHSKTVKFFEPLLELEGGTFTSRGPLLVELDPLSFHVEGGSSFVWKEYALKLDGLLRYEDEKLIMRAPRHGIALNYPMGQILASKGELQLSKVGNRFEVCQIDLLGNVVASYGQPTFQYLIAEGARVVPEEKLATLFSKGVSRVLLYDQINRLEMSANELKVHWGDKLGEERIEGLGDVRFSFDQKEKGIIDALFRSR